jgi:hypothetical protein
VISFSSLTILKIALSKAIVWGGDVAQWQSTS